MKQVISWGTYGKKIISKAVTQDRYERANIPVVVRIACKELENWYLGDMQAIEIVYPASKATSLINKAKYRNPDNLFGAFELGQMTPNFSKTHASREIPKHMIIKNNKSTSFNHFLSGLDKLIAQNSTDIKPPLWTR